MIKSSKAVALILIGSIGVLWGFKSCLNARHDYSADDEFGYGSTTQPGSGSHTSRYPHSTHYFWGSSGSSRSSSSSSHSSSVRSSGTSRGGFGSSGHSAHS